MHVEPECLRKNELMQYREVKVRMKQTEEEAIHAKEIDKGCWSMWSETLALQQME